MRHNNPQRRPAAETRYRHVTTGQLGDIITHNGRPHRIVCVETRHVLHDKTQVRNVRAIQIQPVTRRGNPPWIVLDWAETEPTSINPDGQGELL